MKIIYQALIRLLQGGKLTVEVPGLDTDRLAELLRSEAVRTLEEVTAVVFAEEMTDAEKVEWLQERLQ